MKEQSANLLFAYTRAMKLELRKVPFMLNMRVAVALNAIVPNSYQNTNFEMRTSLFVFPSNQTTTVERVSCSLSFLDNTSHQPGKTLQTNVFQWHSNNSLSIVGPSRKSCPRHELLHDGSLPFQA